jgi:AraC-like DNA-binding protein
MHIKDQDLSIEVTEIKNMMNLLSNLFSIRSSFLYNIGDEQYLKEIAGNNGDYQDFCKLIQEELRPRCMACDRDHFKMASEMTDPLLYRCYNGLYEMFLPLFIEKVIVGYLHFGQVRSEDDFNLIAKECSLSEHSRVKELKKKYNRMNIIKKDKLLLISQLFQKISEIMMKNRLIEIMKTKPEYYLRKYIEEHLSETIDVKSAAKYLNRSPSYITHKFKEIHGKTFHEFLNTQRIALAKELLLTDSIGETFPRCGFKNRYHFSKVFKKMEGKTPGKYKLLAIN